MIQAAPVPAEPTKAETSGLSLRATYRLRVGDAAGEVLIRAATDMAPRGRLDLAGVHQDLWQLLGVLREVRELGHYGLQESLISAATLRAAARLHPHTEDSEGARQQAEREGHGFRDGPMGGLTANERDLLAWATQGLYEAHLEDRTRNPSPQEELAACSLEAGWLAEAFAALGEPEIAAASRRVAEDLYVVVQEIPEVVRVVGRFEKHAGRTAHLQHLV